MRVDFRQRQTGSLLRKITAVSVTRANRKPSISVDEQS